MINFKNFLSEYSDYFLSEDETNFRTIHRQIDDLMSKIQQKIKHINQPLIPIETSFNNYHDAIEDTFLSEKGSSFSDFTNDISTTFEGMIRWHATLTSYNVGQSPLLPTISTSTVVNLYNPNGVMDEVSGNLLVTEKKIIKILSDLAGYNRKESDGMNVSGGAATLMYAIKIALGKFNKNIFTQGICNEYYIITGETNHYFITTICGFLGIGTDKCIRIKSTGEGIMDLDDFDRQYRSLLENGKQVVCVIANGAETINHAIDDVNDINSIINIIINDYGVMKPHVHLDSVNGWIWLAFKNYDFDKNSLDIEISDLSKIKKAYRLISTVQSADSFSADFHKTGLCPYTSAFFVAKNNADLGLIHGNSHNNNPKIGSRVNMKFSIEHSRSGIGIVNAYTVLKLMGHNGLQAYIATLLQSGRYINTLLRSKHGDKFEIITGESNWFVSVIVPRFFDKQLKYRDLAKSNNKTKSKYNNLAEGYYQFLVNENKKGGNYPFLGYIGNHLDSGELSGLIVYKIYGMSVHLNEKKCNDFVKSLVKSFKKFIKKDDFGSKTPNNKRTTLK